MGLSAIVIWSVQLLVPSRLYLVLEVVSHFRSLTTLVGEGARAITLSASPADHA